jgi:hypothetical protein
MIIYFQRIKKQLLPLRFGLLAAKYSHQPLILRACGTWGVDSFHLSSVAFNKAVVSCLGSLKFNFK